MKEMRYVVHSGSPLSPPSLEYRLTGSARRADMGGAATTLSAAWAIASLKLPINLVLCCPLTENMPSGKATKPGDVVVAANGVTIVRTFNILNLLTFH